MVRKASGNREADKLKKVLKGPVASVVLPPSSLEHPPLLSALLRVLDRAAPPPPASTAPAKKADVDEFEKKAKPTPIPKLKVIGAFVDGKIVYEEGVRELAKLPALKELHAQIIGLLSAPASRLAGALSHAAGGQLARTLEGFKKGLESPEGNGEEQPTPSP